MTQRSECGCNPHGYVDMGCTHCNWRERAPLRPWHLVEPEDYAARVEAYEAEGMTTSDAQATVDADLMREIDRLPLYVPTRFVTKQQLKDEGYE